MAARADSFDLGGLKLSPGEARRLDLDVALGDFEFSDERYCTPAAVPVPLDVSRMVGGGYSLRLRLEAQIGGAGRRRPPAGAPLAAGGPGGGPPAGGGGEAHAPPP